MTAIATPCIRLCTIDPLSSLCVGCGRTLTEIGRWTSLNEAERKAIMAILPTRVAASRTERASLRR
jgi:hypothetical protein